MDTNEGRSDGERRKRSGTRHRTRLLLFATIMLAVALVGLLYTLGSGSSVSLLTLRTADPWSFDRLYPWYDGDHPYDVNRDASVTLADVVNVRQAIPAWLELRSRRGLRWPTVLPTELEPVYVANFFDQYGRVDINFDGYLSVDDLISLYNYLSGGLQGGLWQNPVNRFDVNGDGSVTLADVSKVRRGIPAWQQLSSTAKANGGVTDQDSMAFFQSYGYVDVDGDEDTNTNDLTALHRHLNPGSTSLWQNPVNRQDVNADGSVTSADAEKVRDAIGNWQQLPASVKARGGVNDPAGRTFFDRYGYVDVNGDGDVTRADEQAISITAPWRSEGQVPRTSTQPRSQYRAPSSGQQSTCERAKSWGALWRRMLGCE